MMDDGVDDDGAAHDDDSVMGFGEDADM